MNIEKYDEKRENFRTLLLKLASSQTELHSIKEKKKIYLELEYIYIGNNESFRHFYSDIFSVISAIDRQVTFGNVEVLSQNMDIIRKGYHPMNKDNTGKTINIEKQINKLYDHINLEISRLNYSKQIEVGTQMQLDNVSDALAEIERNVEHMEDAVEKADDIQKQYITILGIFASIVLAFTGGIAFSTSVLQNIAKASIYRISLISIILAFALTNLIYILTRFIMEITKKQDERILYPKYMIVLNIIYGIFVLVIIFCWIFNIPYAIQLFQSFIY